MRKEKEIAFALGAIFGSLAALLIQKAYYKTSQENPIRKEEKQEVNPNKTLVKETEKIDILPVSVTKNDLEKEVNKVNLTAYSDILKTYTEKCPVEKSDKPYYIKREDFEELNGYTKMEGCTFYTEDEILADFCDNQIDISVVGFDALGCFGMNKEDPDLIYVRNDDLMTDYEIFRNPHSWKEMTGE